MEDSGAAEVWKKFAGRIGVVLAGGGGRGAYQSGVLLAFQDAQLPTHILTGTSIGAINAASFAAHSKTLVGNAEPLLETWHGLTPSAVGIEWTRYLWIVGGLIAASAGAGNLLSIFLTSRGFQFNLVNPRLTWALLGLSGAAVLLLYDRLPYLGYVIANYYGPASWKPDRHKAAGTIAANLVVWGCLLALIYSLDTFRMLKRLFQEHPVAAAMVAGTAVLVMALRYLGGARLSAFLHNLLRFLLRRGLFTNFERTRLLRREIPQEQWKASPMRVLFPATNLEPGPVMFFSNTPAEELASDPGADAEFVSREVTVVKDLILALVASSALPMVFEPILFRGRLYTDGGLVANQPIRPAVRLGADLVFLVMMDPLGGPREKIRTFIDMGLRALNILLVQNFLTDRRILENINAICERGAAEAGVRPEEVEIDLGTRRYRYVKTFTIHPSAPLERTILDFGGSTSGQAILQGYRDACEQIESFLKYAPKSRFGRRRHLLALGARRTRGE